MPNPSSIAKTILYGSRGPFSATVLKRLVAEKIPITRVVCAGAAPAPSPKGGLPVSPPNQEETLESIANHHHIPMDFITRASDLQTIDLSELKQVDYLLAACFPYRIPDRITHSPRIASLNLHPSLLPLYRGPDPIFWQLKKAEANTGVSLHVLTNKFDAGPVVKQQTVKFEEGNYKKDIESQLGHAGAVLFSSVVTEGLSIDEIAQPQSEDGSSYDPWPSDNDFQLSTDWSARQAFNFIRGTWPPSGHHSVVINNRTWAISQALEYSNDGKMSEPVRAEQRELYIQFTPGILRAHATIV